MIFRTVYYQKLCLSSVNVNFGNQCVFTICKLPAPCKNLELILLFCTFQPKSDFSVATFFICLYVPSSFRISLLDPERLGCRMNRSFYSVVQTHRPDADWCAVNALPFQSLLQRLVFFLLLETLAWKPRVAPFSYLSNLRCSAGWSTPSLAPFTDTHILTGHRESNYLPTSHLCSWRALLKWLAAEMHTDIYFSFMRATLIPTNSNF